MPILKAKELRQLSIDELTQKAEGLKKNLFDLRFKAKLSKLEDLSHLKKARRELAKVLTVRQEMGQKK